MERVDCVVIGAGVVGLACGRALARNGRDVVVLEAEDAVGTQTSARNSEVIHAGIGYAPGSLKSRLCVAGRRALYAYCAERGVAHRRIGKLLVVLDDAERPELERLRRVAAAEGVDDLVPTSAAEARAMEPALHCVGALWSPSTGIVDSHALMLAYLGDAEAAGATLALRSPVTGGRVDGRDGIVLEVGGAEPVTIACRSVVNAAGLRAQDVARAIAGVPAASIPPLHFAIGHYYALAGRAPFSRLVYPVDHAGALRAHVTIDLGGQCKFGPDLRWIDAVDYRFDDRRRDDFIGAIRRYYPGLDAAALHPGYTGIRPRLVGPADSLRLSASDFAIHGAAMHGIAGLVNLFGIESPGLTASLAIADHVAALLARDQPAA